MLYTFSWSAFFFGMIVTAISTCLVVWYQPIADAMTNGTASYDRVRFWGLIGIIVGFIVMLNLHTLLFSWIFGSLFAL